MCWFTPSLSDEAQSPGKCSCPVNMKAKLVVDRGILVKLLSLYENVISLALALDK